LTEWLAIISRCRTISELKALWEPILSRNHEEFDGKTEFIEAAQNSNMQVLDNKNIT